jgi:hypothetical protein
VIVLTSESRSSGRLFIGLEAVSLDVSVFVYLRWYCQFVAVDVLHPPDELAEV